MGLCGTHVTHGTYSRCLPTFDLALLGTRVPAVHVEIKNTFNRTPRNFSADDSLHLEEELELEATKEQNLGLPREKWALGDLKRSLLLVSDDHWFQKGGGMIDLRVLGPSRPSTFKKVFSDVPGAIHGCLKVRYVVCGRDFQAARHRFLRSTAEA